MYSKKCPDLLTEVVIIDFNLLLDPSIGRYDLSKF
jgi:hypothetical protein